MAVAITGSACTIVAPWILRALRCTEPAVEIAMQLSDRMVDLTEEGLDLAIRITTPAQLPPGLVARALRPVRYIAVASPAWLQQLPSPLTHPRDLADLPCITLGYGDFQNQLRWEPVAGAGLTPVELSVHTPITVASSTGIITLALQHQGMGIAADFAAETALTDGRLVQLFPGWQLGGGFAERTAYALSPPTRHLPLKVRALIDHLVGGGG